MLAAGGLEEVFQAELDQPGRDGGLGDDAEICGAEVCARVGELRMIESVIELGPKSELAIFAQAAHGRDFSDGDVGIELPRAGENTDACIAVSRGAVGTQYRGG